MRLPFVRYPLKIFAYIMVVYFIWFYIKRELQEFHSTKKKPEYFSSIVGLEKLFKTEGILLTHLQSYVDSMTEHTKQLKSELSKIEKYHKIASHDPVEYFTNPVNAYLLIKRLHKDWSSYEDAIRNDATQKSLLDALAFSRQNLSYPTETDATESAVAFVRLQDTYQLDVSQMAAGILNGVSYGTSMTWQDCFHLGVELFILKDYEHSKPWLKESLKRLLITDDDNESVTVEILETLAYFHQEMDDFETAMHLTNFVLQSDPKRDLSLAMKDYLNHMIALGHPETNKQHNTQENTEIPKKAAHNYDLYQKICRGEIKRAPWEETHLRCRYISRNVPYRFLMPFKLEEINLDPLLIVVHDVLSDGDVTLLTENSKPYMTRSTVGAYNDTRGISPCRTSQSVAYNFESDPVLQRVKSTIRDISGYAINDKQTITVINYGIGGHYVPHLDFGLSLTREATVMFYLSDVLHGGATAFLSIRVAIQPRKGSMVLWYNLDRSLTGDFRTIHGGCPVIKGSKWIANVWVMKDMLENAPHRLTRMNLI